MRLVELNPEWVGSGGEGVRLADGSTAPRRERVGLEFDCPCGKKDILDGYDFHRCYVGFSNPGDGGPPTAERPAWRRDGDSFETLTLSPSILRDPAKGGCGWHGFIRNGEVVL